MAVRNRIQLRRGYSMGYSGEPIPSGNTGYSYDPTNTTWLGNSVLHEGEIGYEVDTGKFKIGKKDPTTGNLITWENLDYGGGGGGLITGSGIGIYENPVGDDTLYSVLTNTDSNITIEEKQLSALIPNTTGTYYELGLAENLININNISISGELSATSGNFTGGVNIGGNLTVSGDSVTFDSATITLINLTATSGNFTNALTVNGTGVSLEGHGHVWDDIDISNSNFCDDVGDCVNTALIGSSGVQLIYTSGNNTLRAALSGEALAQHEFNSTGFIVRTGSLSYSGRSITNGDNITITNGDGINGNPQISLSGNLTGLTSVTATSFSGNLTGNASSASEISVVNRDTNSLEHYLTFVDSNNGSATNEILYTASGIFFAPLTNTLSVPNISGTITQANTIRTSTIDTNSTFYITFVDSDNSVPGSYESLYTDSAIKYNPSSNLVTFDGDISASSANISNNLIVEGNLTVNGTTVTANVDSITVEDPILTLGKPSGTLAAESKDRGIEFVYPSGTSTIAATGFFGFDKSATQFIAAKDVTISNEVVSVNNNSYLDAKFNDINGSTITASQQFDGPGSGLTGLADSLEVGKAKNISSGATGSIPYQTTSNATTFLSIGTSGQFLRVNNENTAPYWDTVTYAEIGDLPTIGSGILTLNVSGSGLSGSASFGANDTGNTTFTVTSNATPVNSGSTIVSRDSSGNFSANIITAALSGNADTATTATNANNIEVDVSNANNNYMVFVNGNDGNLKPNVNSNLKFDALNNIFLGSDSTTPPTTRIEYFIIDGGTP